MKAGRKIPAVATRAPLGPASKYPKDVRPPQPQQQSPASVLMTNDTIKEAADTAAYRVDDAESKSYLAAEAVKEAEKISLLVEHSDSMLQLAKDIYEQCTIDKRSFLPLICEFFNLLLIIFNYH